MTIYPRLIYDNLWRKGGNSLPSDPTADPQHPVSDTQIDTLSMFWKSSDKDQATQHIEMDLKAGTRSINFIAILGHNIPEGEAGDITFEEADADTFAGAVATTKFTWSANNMFKFLDTPLTKQFVRLVLVNGGLFATAPQVATILCGSYTEFNRRPLKGYIPGKDDVSGIEESDARVVFAQERPLLDEHKYKFEALDDTTEAVILLFLEECGKTKGFVWCMDHALPNANSYFVRNSEIINPEYQYPDVWKWTISMKEIV